MAKVNATIYTNKTNDTFFSKDSAINESISF
jgi:hypothetical protein